MSRHRTATAFAALITLAGTTLSLGQSPDGIYLMTRVWSSYLETGVFFFAPGVAVNAPNYDIATYGTELAEQQNPALVGDLSLSGDTMRVDWHDGEVTQSTIEPSSDGCFYWDAGQFCPVDTFSEPALSGVFYGGDALGGGTSAFASGGRTIYFEPDGRYAMGSSTSIDAYAGGVDMSATGEQLETGQYRIGPNSIDFMPDGGQSWSTASFPYHDADSAGDYPNRIYFDGVMMTRQ
jgi:hypothetical protein